MIEKRESEQKFIKDAYLNIILTSRIFWKMDIILIEDLMDLNGFVVKKEIDGKLLQKALHLNVMKIKI